MHRINTSTAVPDANGAGRAGFRDGNLAIGQQPTALNALFFNAVQEELANVIEGAGIALDSAVKTQLLSAINTLVLGRFTGSNQSTAFQRFPGGLILQWGTILSNSSGLGTLTFPLAFPTAAELILGNHSGSDSAIVNEVTGTRTVTGVQLQVKNRVGATDVWLINWLAIGR